MIQRTGEVVHQMLANVQQKTIQPILKQTIQAGSLIFTDEYDVYARLEQWGFRHKTVNHAAGDYAREGFWSLLRSWLRPHRGISQEQLPLYLAFFESVHNMRRRGKALLESLLASLLTP